MTRPARLLALITIALTACHDADNTPKMRDELATLRAEVAALKAHSPAPAATELGEQMLMLQIRHARLWLAIEQRNWDLALFQTAELREAVAGIVETQPDHAALQPERLAEVMPAFMTPALGQLNDALAARDPQRAEAAFDGLSAACTGCHVGASFTFLQIHRPGPRLLDNLGAPPAR